MNQLVSGLRGFKFNNISNKDMNVVMHSKSIDPPAKKKIKESVPFMHGSYDFSTIGSDNGPLYSERSITLVLGIPANNKEQLQVLYSNTLEWLQDVGKQQLVFDDIKDYYYMAEVEEASSFDQVMEFGVLTVKFVADPFKRSVEYVGSDVWDVFNFEEDTSQDNQYYVSGYREIMLYNPGRRVKPIINCDTFLSIIQNGKAYNLSSGDNKLYGFYLDPLTNDLKVNGHGTIKFIFRKEKI
jgi:phage-related protein